jgi:hypothetical protein
MNALDSVIEYEKVLTEFRRAGDPARIAAAVEEGLAKVRDHFTVGGVSAVPAAVLQDSEAQLRAAYDERLRETAAKLRAELADTEKTIKENIELVGQLADPLEKAAARYTSATEHELAKLRIGLDLDRAERRLTGKPLAGRADLYEQATDERDEALIYVIETQARTGWRDIPLTGDSNDAAAVLRLRRLIEARQRARVEKAAPDLLEAQARLKAALPAQVRDLFGHLLDQHRGLALVRT